MLAGKWKTVILQHLAGGKLRFIQLWRLLPRVSKKVLPEQLRQLEADGLVQRHEYLTFPPAKSLFSLLLNGQVVDKHGLPIRIKILPSRIDYLVAFVLEQDIARTWL
jgi:DNA-binding HxlR family transcriptional regulator